MASPGDQVSADAEAESTRTEADLAWTTRLRRRRSPVPTVLQMEATECAAACLAMILAKHGRWIPLEQLRVSCGVSRDGASARGILLAGRAHGLIADGYHRELAQLPHEPFPVIAYWQFTHFVVVEGVDRHGVFLNDPAIGRIKATWHEADRDFTGVVIHASPRSDFDQYGRASSAWRGLGLRLAGSWSALLFLAIACVALAMPVALSPVALQGYIDQVIVNELPDWIPTTLTVLLFAAVLTAWLTWWQQVVARRLGLALSHQQAINFVHQALRLPMSFFTQRYAGDVAFRVQLVDDISQLIAMQLIPAVVGLVTAAAVGVTLLLYSWQLAVVALGSAVTVGFTVRKSAQWRRSAAGRYAREQSNFAGSLAYGLRTIESVKASGTQDDLFVMSSGTHARALNALTRLTVSGQILGALPTLTSGLATAIFISVGGLLVMDGQLSPGGFVAVLTLLPLFLGPIGAWAGFGSSLQQTAASLDRIDDLLEYPADPLMESDERRVDSAAPPTLGSASQAGAASLELRNITFGFSAMAPPIIENFSLHLSAGRKVGLVGISGCGKSTVARLAVGLLTPWSGEVCVNGVPIADLPTPCRVAALGYVDQEVVLFPGTVRDNITLFDPRCSDQEVVAAARTAGIHDEISARPGSYDCVVAEGGANFSGGQRQRIEIARAVAGAPGLLVLDEATSDLDPIKELEVMAALADSGAGLLIIAHRLSTVRDCDEIVVLDEGHIVERGTHEQLVASSGRYCELVTL